MYGCCGLARVSAALGATARWGAVMRKAVLLLVAWAGLTLLLGPFGVTGASGATTPIQHVVVIEQENHTFDNVLGQWCIQASRCDGADHGYSHKHDLLPLSRASDVVWGMSHTHSDQVAAIDGGKMDGFDLVKNCGARSGFACYTQYYPDQIPNLVSLANQFTVSDRTFQSYLAASWGSHLELVAGTADGFLGNNPSASTTSGWGCDSGKTADWTDPNTGLVSKQPSCVPDYALP